VEANLLKDDVSFWSGVEIPHCVEDITEDIHRSSYATATVYLTEYFSYIFQQPDGTVSKYTGHGPKKSSKVLLRSMAG